MPIPPFDHRGLLPQGIHDCGMEDPPPRFCFNDYRWTLWDDVLRGLDEVCDFVTRDGLKEVSLCIGGSFLSDKPLPSDMEATLVFASEPSAHICTRWIKLWMDHHERLKAEHRLDFYPSMPGMNDFRDFFQYVGEKTAQAKGIAPLDRRGIVRVAAW